jgi:hypothetical protein
MTADPLWYKDAIIYERGPIRRDVGVIRPGWR